MYTISQKALKIISSKEMYKNFSDLLDICYSGVFGVTNYESGTTFTKFKMGQVAICSTQKLAALLRLNHFVNVAKETRKHRKYFFNVACAPIIGIVLTVSSLLGSLTTNLISVFEFLKSDTMFVSSNF